MFLVHNLWTFYKDAGVAAASFQEASHIGRPHPPAVQEHGAACFGHVCVPYALQYVKKGWGNSGLSCNSGQSGDMLSKFFCHVPFSKMEFIQQLLRLLN